MRFLLIVLVSLGCFFRLAQLDHKLYWYDETFTSLRAVGYTEAEVVQHFANSDIATAAALQQFQQPAPNRGIADTVHSLASEDNHHPPLYYALASLWSRWVGSSVAEMRLLPALLSLLALPAVYWLCWELFGEGSRLPCWVAVALFAVSPFQINYGQESRQYGLWAVLTLLATAALLRAFRRQTFGSWLLYALTLTASFYTFLLAGLVAVAYGIYGLCAGLADKHLRQGWMSYLTASLLSGVAFLPWLWVLVSNLSHAEAMVTWINTSQTWQILVLTRASMIARIFYDRGETLLDRCIQIGVLLLVGYAFYYLRFAPRRVWLLIGLLTITPVLPLLLADLVSGGVRSMFPRYFIPTIIGIQLAVVHLLSVKLNPLLSGSLSSGSLSPSSLSSGSLPNSRHWRWIAAALCCAGVVSSAASFSALTWWQKSRSHDVPFVAQVINQQMTHQSVRPLLVSDAKAGDLITLSHRLQPDVAILIRPRCATCKIPASHDSLNDLLTLLQQPIGDMTERNSIDQLAASDQSGDRNHTSETGGERFLYHPDSSKLWRQALEHHPNYRFVPVELPLQREVLWRIVNK